MNQDAPGPKKPDQPTPPPPAREDSEATVVHRREDILNLKPENILSLEGLQPKKAPQPEEKARPRGPIDPAQAHVLVVEDNVPNFVLIARLLAYMGVQRCEWKTSGWQVVEFADTLPRIDLILMDIRLPYEDGFQALKRLRDSPRLKDTLVVAVTAEASAEQMDRAKTSGFDGFLAKPLDPDKFPEQIRRVLNGEPVWEWKTSANQ